MATVNCLCFEGDTLNSTWELSGSLKYKCRRVYLALDLELLNWLCAQAEKLV